ncbi:ATP-grasp domain-containing protein [Niallia sp. 01092]|uniref:ATP-grasp domain-containing protein n=1 Tax=unclassified Niallia TaxID=2837522 RepID=UPI003FD10BFD
MQTIVFLGSNKSGSSRDAVFSAANLGYFIVLLTDREKFIEQRDEFSDVDLMILMQDLLDENKVKEKISYLESQGKEIKACISLIDPFVYLAAKITADLDLAPLSVEALKLMGNKIDVRKELSSIDVNPFFISYQNESIDEFVENYKEHLPLVIKPPVSNGSKDVLLVETIDQFRNGLTFLKDKLSNSPILMEGYINGPQYIIEVVCYESTVHIVGVVEQEISHHDRFIITGYNFPALLNEEDYENLQISVSKIVSHLNLQNGSCHLEMRSINGKWKLIEINPRISGGAMNRIIKEATGINLTNEIIKLYLGKEPSFEKKKKLYVSAQFSTIETRGTLLRVTGRNRASKYPGVKEVYVKPRKGAVINKPQSLGDRYAYVIAVSEDPEEVKRIAKSAVNEIKFLINPM